MKLGDKLPVNPTFKNVCNWSSGIQAHHLVRLQNRHPLFVISKRIWTLYGTRIRTTTPKQKLKTVHAVLPSKDNSYCIWLHPLGYTQKATFNSCIGSSIRPALSFVNELSYNLTKQPCMIFLLTGHFPWLLPHPLFCLYICGCRKRYKAPFYLGIVPPHEINITNKTKRDQDRILLRLIDYSSIKDLSSK